MTDNWRCCCVEPVDQRCGTADGSGARPTQHSGAGLLWGTADERVGSASLQGRRRVRLGGGGQEASVAGAGAGRGAESERVCLISSVECPSCPECQRRRKSCGGAWLGGGRNWQRAEGGAADRATERLDARWKDGKGGREGLGCTGGRRWEHYLRTLAAKQCQRNPGNWKRASPADVIATGIHAIGARQH